MHHITVRHCLSYCRNLSKISRQGVVTTCGVVMTAFPRPLLHLSRIRLFRCSIQKFCINVLTFRLRMDACLYTNPVESHIEKCEEYKLRLYTAMDLYDVKYGDLPFNSSSIAVLMVSATTYNVCEVSVSIIIQFLTFPSNLEQLSKRGFGSNSFLSLFKTHLIGYR